jgi:hypothetical protein
MGIDSALLLSATLTDKVPLQPASSKECLRLDLLAKCSLVALPSRLMYLVAVPLHPDPVCGTEAVVVSDPALINLQRCAQLLD